MKARNLFIIDSATMKAVSQETITQTVADLKTLGLYKLPYNRVAVRMPLDVCCVTADKPGFFVENLQKYKGGALDFVKDPKTGRWRSNFGPDHCVEFRNLNLEGEPTELWFIHEINTPRWRPYEFRDTKARWDNHAEVVSDLLITLLATKNALKRTHHNTLANRIPCKRPGSTRAYEYVTTISIPSELEDDTEHPPTGGTKCPHLRRGHIRRQHYGPKMAFIKQIWIEPVFVNADPTFVSHRKAYNLGV